MLTFVPTYYFDFKCIADNCKHTCCMGWEIDVDADSLIRFNDNASVKTFIKDGQFILDEDERCPFLRSDGLCQMIIDNGEDYLCDICKDHPRFRKFFDDHIEMGIGLCCEEAVRVVLEFKGKFELVNLTDRNMSLLSDETIEVLQNSQGSIIDRINSLYKSSLSSCERVSIYEPLERLDDKWTKMLDFIKNNPVSIDSRINYICNNANEFEQLIVYFLFRHDYNVAFAIESAYLIADLCVSGFDLFDVVRMYSSEIEYSDVNIDTLLFDVFLD